MELFPKILVDNKEIVETASEKLLGVVINNQLTWKKHLYGDENNKGWIPQLLRRIGILWKISKKKYFLDGTFLF